MFEDEPKKNELETAREKLDQVLSWMSEGDDTPERQAQVEELRQRIADLENEEREMVEIQGEKISSQPETQSSIGDAQSFESLYATIEKEGGVQGSKKHYSPQELEKEIEGLGGAMVQADSLSDEDFEEFLSQGGPLAPLGRITEKSGLRKKVKELFIMERKARQIAKKNAERN